MSAAQDQQQDAAHQEPYLEPQQPIPEAEEDANEDTPLLACDERTDESDEPDSSRRGDASGSGSPLVSNLLHYIRGRRNTKKSWLRRWPSILALTLLCVFVAVILVGGFFAPDILQEYSNQAAHVEPERISVDSFTNTGVMVRVEGSFSINKARVSRMSVRNFGSFATWLAHEAETGEADLEASLPEQDGLVLGTAKIPPIRVNLRSGQTTPIDLLTEVKPGSFQGLRRIASDLIDGRIGQLRIQGVANVSIKSGIISVGKQKIAQSLTLNAGSTGDGDSPLPSHKLQKLSFKEIPLPGELGGLAAEASVVIANDYPVEFTFPPMGFSILVDDCFSNGANPPIMIADATTDSIRVRPREDIVVNAGGFVRELPEPFLKACPGSSDSPLDSLVGNYLRGKESTLYVSGSDAPSPKTPSWVTDLLYGVTVPVPFTGHLVGDLIKNFTMSNVHFSLPDFFAEPGSPDAQPKISATVEALISLPEEINFSVDVNKIRSSAEIFYHDKKLGNLDLRRWHDANSKKVTYPNGTHPDLEVQSHIEKAPLNITDESVFQKVVQALLRGKSNNLDLTVNAEVDVDATTALGTFVIRKIPASGVVPIKAVGTDLTRFRPEVDGLKIVETYKWGLDLEARVNFSNPTEYSATLPYADVHVVVNDTILGMVNVKNVSIHPGKNENVPVRAAWWPSKINGTEGSSVGRELLSQYISGYNTTLTFKTFPGTIPSHPTLGRALSFLSIDLPTPHLGAPGKGKHPSFIKDATMHIFTSTSTFTLVSPLVRSTLYVTHINATASYYHSPVGTILYDDEIEVPPGESETPRLPVEWDPGSVGFDAVKKALGGRLKLSATAEVGVRVGAWRQRIWYSGKEIGARVRV